MPASDNPKKDMEIFLKILTMDEEGLWLRKNKSIPADEIYKRLSPSERKDILKKQKTARFPIKKALPEKKKKTSRDLPSAG